MAKDYFPTCLLLTLVSYFGESFYSTFRSCCSKPQMVNARR